MPVLISYIIICFGKQSFSFDYANVKKGVDSHDFIDFFNGDDLNIVLKMLINVLKKHNN